MACMCGVSIEDVEADLEVREERAGRRIEGCVCVVEPGSTSFVHKSDDMEDMLCFIHKK